MKFITKILSIGAVVVVSSGLGISLTSCKFTEWDYPTFTANIPDNYGTDFSSVTSLKYECFNQLQSLRIFYNAVVDPDILVDNQKVWETFDNYLPDHFNLLLQADIQVWNYWTKINDIDHLIPGYYNIMGIDANLANWCYLGMNYLLTDFYNSLLTDSSHLALINELPKPKSKQGYLELLSKNWTLISDRLSVQHLFNTYNQTNYPNGYKMIDNCLVLNFQSYLTLFKNCLSQMNEIMSMTIPDYLINPNHPSEKN